MCPGGVVSIAALGVMEGTPELSQWVFVPAPSSACTSSLFAANICPLAWPWVPVSACGVWWYWRCSARQTMVSPLFCSLILIEVGQSIHKEGEGDAGH